LTVAGAGPAPASVALVVDASVSAAWFLPDEATPFTEAVLSATATAEVWVPALWWLEIGNLLLNAQRRQRISAAKRIELLAAAQALRLRVDREPLALATIDALADHHRLSAYDVAYLELALRRQLPLATQDAALLAAMAQAGVLAPAV
jgi:predicted nucleic acid-binding protein